MKTKIRKFMGYSLAIGATLGVGLLAFAGMFALSPSLWLCGGAFVMAAVYEGHINHENIAQALVRIFDTKYLQLALVRQRIHLQLKNNRFENNLFLKKYRQLELEIKKTKHALEHHAKNITLKIKLEQALKIAEEKKRELEMHYYVRIVTIKGSANTIPEIDTLCLDDATESHDVFLQKLSNRKLFVRLGGICSAAGGIAASFATLSIMQVSFAAFAITSAIPGGILVTLAVFAGVGYSLLIYRSISEMIEQYSIDKIKNYFVKKKNESNASYVARCVLTVVGVALAVFATIATAGTWWYAAKYGAQAIGLFEKLASAVRTITITLMAIPTLAYAASNSISAAEQVSRMSIPAWFQKLTSEIHDTWKKENIAQFFNPFRFIEKTVTGVAKSALFLFHVVCDGVMSDRPGFASPTVAATLSSGSAAFVEAPQIGGEEHSHGEEEEGGHNHSHDSIFLSIIYLPVTIISVILKACGCAWDFFTSGCKSFKESKEKFFPKEEEHHHHHHSHDDDDAKPKDKPHTHCDHHHDNEHDHKHDDEHSDTSKLIPFEAAKSNLQTHGKFAIPTASISPPTEAPTNTTIIRGGLDSLRRNPPNPK